MRRSEVLSRLRDHLPEIRALGIQSLALFGSVARDEARPDSDIDLLVEFSSPVGLFDFQRAQSELSRLLGGRVDLVPRDSIKRQFRDQILRVSVSAA